MRAVVVVRHRHPTLFALLDSVVHVQYFGVGYLQDRTVRRVLPVCTVFVHQYQQIRDEEDRLP